MDEHTLQAMHRAAQPVLQRTAPVESQAKLALTPAVLDHIAWNVVLAYVANVAERPPHDIPRQAQSGERSLRDEEVRGAVQRLSQAAAEPRLKPSTEALARFDAAARRLLGAYGWSPRRAEQAAGEIARALQARFV